MIRVKMIRMAGKEMMAAADDGIISYHIFDIDDQRERITEYREKYGRIWVK